MLHSDCRAHTRCGALLVILTEGFHLTAARWGMLGGRNKELNKLCYSSPFHVWERVNARAAALRLHTVLLCLFYFVSSINDEAPGAREREREREALRPPWGKSARSWAQSPQQAPPPPSSPARDRKHHTLRTCGKWKIRVRPQSRIQSFHCTLSSFFIQMNFDIKWILASIKM